MKKELKRPVNIMMTASTKERLKSLAERSGVSVPDYLARLIMDNDYIFVRSLEIKVKKKEPSISIEIDDLGHEWEQQVLGEVTAEVVFQVAVKGVGEFTESEISHRLLGVFGRMI